VSFFGPPPGWNACGGPDPSHANVIDFGINISVVSRPTQVVLRGNLHLPAGGGVRFRSIYLREVSVKRGGGEVKRDVWNKNKDILRKFKCFTEKRK
jgi:hypothetical protein